MSIYLLIIGGMRRKAGALVPLELAICVSAAELRAEGIDEFYGYQIARQLGEHSDSRLLTAYGTLYRALDRLATMGMLTSRWESPEIPARENRPGRRLYALTGLAERAVAAAQKPVPVAVRARRRLARA
jgi:PadR family transcriptional regulator PadR